MSSTIQRRKEEKMDKEAYLAAYYDDNKGGSSGSSVHVDLGDDGHRVVSDSGEKEQIEVHPDHLPNWADTSISVSEEHSIEISGATEMIDSHERSDINQLPRPGRNEVYLDPYEYLINLETSDPQIEAFDASTRGYLSLLGRSAELEKRKGDMDKETLAREEIIAGWRVLRDSKYPPHGFEQRGVFLSSLTITTEAVDLFPTMPWLHILAQDQLQNALAGPKTISEGRGEIDISQYEFSPYVRPSRYLLLVLSADLLTNAIVPLPPDCIDQSHELFPELIEHIWGRRHPLRILAQEPYITQDHGEAILLITRDLYVSRNHLRDPYNMEGLNRQENEVYLDYIERYL